MRWLLPLLCLTLSFNALASTTPATSQQTVDKVLVLKSERKLHLQQRGDSGLKPGCNELRACNGRSCYSPLSA